MYFPSFPFVQATWLVTGEQQCKYQTYYLLRYSIDCIGELDWKGVIRTEYKSKLKIIIKR
jgi:hypothetical protein